MTAVAESKCREAAEELEAQIPKARENGDRLVRELRAKAIREWSLAFKEGDEESLERRRELLRDMYVDRAREVLDAVAFLIPDGVAAVLPANLDEQVADRLFANNEARR